MNVVREIQKLSEKELERNTPLDQSWHQQYKDSAWVYIGNMDFKLTEGDVICFMSQWGEVEDLHLVREKDTGKSKGFAFLKYEDQRSTVLAVDNFNGIKLLDRTLRVDHVQKYRLPKDLLEKEEARQKELLEGRDPGAKQPLWKPGHAYEGKDLASEYDMKKGVDLFKKPEASESEEEEEEEEEQMVVEEERREKKRLKKEEKKRKKEAKHDKKKKRKRKREEDDSRDKDSRSAQPDDKDVGQGPASFWGSALAAEASKPLSLTAASASEGTVPPSDGPSWRGRLDPTKRPLDGGGRGGGRGRGAFRGRADMFGAMNRKK